MLAQTDPLELLAQDALVPVTFNAGGTALGPSMDPSSGTRDLQPGTQVSVPLWMVRTLAERRMVNVRLPPVYSERYRRKLNAGAECVSLKNVAPYFYEVGNRLNEVLKDVELATFLSRTFRTRYHELISKGLNTMTGEEVLKLNSKLSVEEQQLFEAGRVSVRRADAWWKGDAAQLPGGVDALQPGAQPQHPMFKRSGAEGAGGGGAAGAMGDAGAGGDTAKRQQQVAGGAR